MKRSIEKLIIEKKLYNNLKPRKDVKLQLLVDSLSQCTVSKLDHDIELICLKDEFFLKTLSSRFLYSRSFYPQLLHSIRKMKSTVLISNPGTGKSMFQFYYLARLLNPSVFEDRLPNNLRIENPPEVVLRQVGSSEMQIFFIKDRVSRVTDVSMKIFKCFDPKTTLYFFEPADTTKMEPMWPYTDMDIFATSEY